MARQTSIIASAIIPAPPQRVWEIACDSSRYPEWVENTVRMIHTDGLIRAGATMEELTRIAGPWKYGRLLRHRIEVGCSASRQAPRELPVVGVLQFPSSEGVTITNNVTVQIPFGDRHGSDRRPRRPKVPSPRRQSCPSPRMLTLNDSE